MTSPAATHRTAAAPSAPSSARPGLALVGLVLVAAASVVGTFGQVPFLVAAMVGGMVIGAIGLATPEADPGLRIAAKTLLRGGIVLLGLRLSVHDVAALGFATLAVVVATVGGTFFAVQMAGRRMGLSAGLTTLIASGFSICGNSAIASVKGATRADDDEVAAAVGLVTIGGTLALFLLPTAAAMLGLSEHETGLWAGASVQDTGQVIAVASAVGPTALAVATAVKLTRVLFLAPIVTAASIAHRSTRANGTARPPLLPLFVVGFVVALLVRTTGLVPSSALTMARSVEQYALAAGMVGLGSSVRLASLRNLGLKPLAVGLLAWMTVAAVPLLAIAIFDLGGV